MSETVSIDDTWEEFFALLNRNLSLETLKTSGQIAQQIHIKKEAFDRKRNILYLIFAYLREQNLNSSADSLQTEAQLTNDVEVCDNVDLDTILQEYQSYYCAKFGKAPKITKRIKNTTTPPKETRKKAVTASPTPVKVQEARPLEFQFEVRKLLGSGDDEAVKVELERPLCDFEGYSGEWREMADVILREVIVPSNLGVKWSDCVGLDKCVQLLKEAVILPLLHPSVFTGLVAPWRGVLLYGPPGTGKTLLSKAVACESRMKFFNVTSSGFIHKWRGDSEKMLKVLFDVAKLRAPSTIFIDELDALTSTCDLQHDASRRFRSELLVQLDGVLRDDDQVFILATTNRPWDLDSAILRRFEKRVLVDLPCKEARSEIFKYYFSKNGHRFTDLELKQMADGSVKYSGSDIKIACREACMSKLRKEFEKGTKIENMKINSPYIDDVVRSLSNIRPVTNSCMQEKYKKWRDDFGSY